MGRKFILVSAVVALLLGTCEMTLAQGHKGHGGGMGRPGGQIRSSPNFQRNVAPQRFYQMSPEEQQQFRRNAERWLQMNPEQQRILREREAQRLQRMRIEADAAMNQSGLRLEGPAREQFEARYLQERRRIERQLREETEAKRQQQLPQLNEKLKNEFQSPRNNSSVSPNPSKSDKERN